MALSWLVGQTSLRGSSCRLGPSTLSALFTQELPGQLHLTFTVPDLPLTPLHRSVLIHMLVISQLVPFCVSLRLGPSLDLRTVSLSRPRAPFTDMPPRDQVG